jgi:hypothetical protein
VKRSYTTLVTLCCLALFVPLVFPLLTGRVFTKDDLAAWHIPFRYVYWTALHRGDSFAWTRAVLSGMYLQGEGEVGMLHPLHLILYGFLRLGAAVNLEIVSTYVAFLTGTALLFARLGLTREAAGFGALLFAFSGFTIFNLPHLNHLAALSHMPWLLWTTHVLLTSADGRRRVAAFAGLVLTAASQWLVGNPQYVWISYLALGFLTVCLLLDGAPFARLTLLAMALGLGAAIGAAQLLPTLDYAGASIRTLWAADQALSYSLSPLNLVQLWSPFAFHLRIVAPRSESQMVHEFVVYNGAFCTVALAWIAVRFRQLPQRRTAAALLVLGALGLLLAFGRYGPYAWIAGWPGFRNFRAPARHVVLFQLALSGLAAVAFDDLLALLRRGETLDWRRARLLLTPAAASIVVTAIAVALAPTAWAAAHDLPFSSALRAAPAAVPVVGMAVLFTLAARGVTWAVPVAIVCAAADLGVWGYAYAYRWGPLRSVAALAAEAHVPPSARAGDLIVPMTGDGPVDLPLLRDLRLTTGYNGVEPASRLDWQSPLTARLAGAQWEPAGAQWVAVTDSMPRARLVTSSRVTADPAADIGAIDVRTQALVDRPIAPLSGIRGVVRVVADRPGAIEVETQSVGRQLLVVTDRFHPGWRATEDGSARETIAVDGDFLGCVVEAGAHRVTLTFQPVSLRLGLWTTAAGVALTGVVTVLLWPRRTRGALQFEAA